MATSLLLVIACLLRGVDGSAGLLGSLQRPDARVLYLELPLESGFMKAPKFAVAPGLTMDLSRPARVWIAYYRTANVSWAGSPGESSLQNVPHHEMNIQFPVTYKGSKFYQTVYHLTDDDVAMLQYRDTQGAPSKPATFDFPLESPTAFSVTRRTEKLVSLEGKAGESIDAGSSDLQGLFDNTLNLFGTQAIMTKGIGPMNSVFLHIRNSVNVKAAWKFDVSAMSVLTSDSEPIAKFFESSVKPTKAYWLQADIGSESDPAPVNVGNAGAGLSNMNYFLKNFMFKYGGKQIHAGEPKQKGNGFQWQNGRFLWVSVKIKPQMAQKQIPPGTVLADDTAQIFVAWYPQAALLQSAGVSDNYPYHELGIRLQVKMVDDPKGKVYHHVTYILVDDDIALFTGRDMLGTPKKMLSKIVFPDDMQNPKNGDKASMYIERRGQVVFNFTGVVGGNRTTDVPGMTDGMKDLSVFGNQAPFYFNESNTFGAPLYVQWAGSHNVLENRDVNDADITFGSSTYEPLDSWLVSGPPLAAGFFRMDYCKPTDFALRPVIGKMAPGDGPAAYWRNIYQSHYGGSPVSSEATTLTI